MLEENLKCIPTKIGDCLLLETLQVVLLPLGLSHSPLRPRRSAAANEGLSTSSNNDSPWPGTHDPCPFASRPRTR
eukprot:750678-Hanusia_phi.AAC.2